MKIVILLLILDLFKSLDVYYRQSYLHLILNELNVNLILFFYL